MALITKDDLIERLNRVVFKSFIINEFVTAAHFFKEIHTSMPLLQERRVKELEQEFIDAGMNAEEYWEARQALDGRFQHGMPRVLCWSYLIFLCGLMEAKLRAIANILANHKSVSLEEWLEPPKPAKSPDGSYVEKYRQFITKNSTLDISQIVEWNFLSDLALIRNCLVHSGGQLPVKNKKRQQFRNMLGRYNGLIGAEPDLEHQRAKLIITEYFCQKATVELCNFFNTLHDKIVNNSIIPIGIYQGIY